MKVNFRKCVNVSILKIKSNNVLIIDIELCDDTMDNTNVVVDTLDEEDDDKESTHGVVKVVVELYFIPIHRNIIN